MTKRHYCAVCKRMTLWRFIGYQRDLNGSIAFALWNCERCGASKSLGLPDKEEEK